MEYGNHRKHSAGARNVKARAKRALLLPSLIRPRFTRCRHILKTVIYVKDRPPIHTTAAHFLPADFENARF